MAQPKDSKKLRELYAQRWQALKTERSGWLSHWQQMSTYLLPYNGRYVSSDRNRGDRRFNQILDSTGTRAVITLAAGMMAGMTSPARPWFRLATPDPKLMEAQPVKVWLHDVTRLMLEVFQRSNTYNTLHMLYQELGVFGTAATFLRPDFQDVVRHYPMTAGEYAIAADERGVVSTLYREFDMTVGQMVQRFGLNNCSSSVRDLYSKGAIDKWRTVVHVVEPNTDRDASKRDNRNMPWTSAYYEVGSEDREFLSRSGFRRSPLVVPRWQTLGGDVYGVSPGMMALGDVKQLQHEQLRKAEGIDYATKPPLQVPSSLKNDMVNTLPGGINYVDVAGQGAGIRSAWEVRLDLQPLLLDIQDVRQRIRETFYVDMFLMLANNDLRRMTATEVAERHEEKLLMLGPVLERLHNEMLDPLVETTFDRLVEAGVLPPAPPELEGQELNIEFVSMLAQAQRAVGVNSADRFVMTLGTVAQFKPEVLDKFDADRWADLYADQLGVDPSMIVAGPQVAIVREQRAQQAAAAQALAAADQAAVAARNLAAADTSQPNGLTDLTQLFQGYSLPQ